MSAGITVLLSSPNQRISSVGPKSVFILPLLTHIKKMKRGDFKTCLEESSLKDVGACENAHLSKNKTVMRIKLWSA